MSNAAISLPKNSTKIPVHSIQMWASLGLALIVVMVATMYKDWWLTGDAPNIWFYVFMPPADILGGTLAMYLAVKVFRQMPKFLELLAITLGVTICMQVMEIITKLVYHKVWEYPGFLYFLLVFPLWFLLTSYALVRFTGLRWKMALLVSVLGFIGSLLFVGLFQSITGLETPGS